LWKYVLNFITADAKTVPQTSLVLNHTWYWQFLEFKVLIKSNRTVPQAHCHWWWNLGKFITSPQHQRQHQWSGDTHLPQKSSWTCSLQGRCCWQHFGMHIAFSLSFWTMATVKAYRYWTLQHLMEAWNTLACSQRKWSFSMTMPHLHTAHVTMQQFCWGYLAHPPYCLDLAP
jgi:hypothetical protein